jgi:hypothetical protein
MAHSFPAATTRKDIAMSNRNPDAGSERNGGLDRKSAGREGAKFITPFPRDNSSHALKGVKGGSMGGSVTNLSHSLSGVSANQKGPR